MSNYLKILGLFGVISFTACKKYLDVKPQNQLLETQVFSTETGINTALNNVYISMASDALYGGSLTIAEIEVMGQQFVVYPSYNDDEDYGALQTYNYGNTAVKKGMDVIWRAQYKNIIDINNLIANLKTSKVLGASKNNIIIGEAYALRAMAHFDLLRLFGPVYATSPGDPSIPYYTEATTTAQPILTAAEAIAQVLTDLNTAEEFLADDPIKTLGKQEALVGDGKDFYRFRNLRMNYYAVKALKARVQLYAGNHPDALMAAKEVITAGATLFPWTDPSAVINAGNNPDRIFSPEIIFALQNTNLYDQHARYFENIGIALAPTVVRLAETYEDARDNDYRYRVQFVSTNDQFNPIRVFKFRDIDDKSLLSRYMQPMIRMSEMYYIAAETETDPAAAFDYLNIVRNNRGLLNLDDGADLETEITKEYQKEFIGEGQMFFYYKRKNMDVIPDGTDQYGGSAVYGPGYIAPLPESETIYR